MYMGSDTEPPCNEDVQWFVMKDALIVSSTVFNRLKDAVLGGGDANARDTLPLMDREVIYH